MWERAKAARNGRPWMKVAEDMVATFKSTWPAELCTEQQAASVAVTLSEMGLRDRFTGLHKRKVVVGALRKRALAIIKKTQLYLPPDSTPLWTFFRTGENTIVNKGALAKKDASIQKSSKERKKTQGVQALCGILLFPTFHFTS